MAIGYLAHCLCDGNMLGIWHPVYMIEKLGLWHSVGMMAKLNL